MAKSNRKALFKPFQLLGLSALFGVFVVLVVLLTTQNLTNALIGGGATFILSLVVLAMLVLSYRPNAEVPVYLDRFQADSDEPGAKSSALKVDADAALRGEPAPEDREVDEPAAAETDPSDDPADAGDESGDDTRPES